MTAADGSLMGAYRWCSHLVNASEVMLLTTYYHFGHFLSVWLHAAVFC